MAFNLSLTPARLDLVERTHAFAEDVVRPVAEEYEQKQEFPRCTSARPPTVRR